MTQPFGFMVQRTHTDDQRNGKPWQEWQSEEPAGWAVWLPHQCSSWSIAADDYDGGVPQAEAAAELERFIAEAQRALAALRAGESFGMSEKAT